MVKAQAPPVETRLESTLILRRVGPLPEKQPSRPNSPMKTLRLVNLRIFNTAV